jgi:uncharacterized protein
MTRVLRFDRGEISKAVRTPQGFIKAPAFFTRTGVFQYKKADGTIVRELRHPDDVFNAESLNTLKGIPLTNDHPEIMLIDSKSAKKYMSGYTGDALDLDGEKVGGTVTITDKDLIEAIEDGKKQQLSCGYTHVAVDESGVYMGEKYDVRQTNIIYNHVASVDRGRAGPEVRLRLDSADAVMIENDKEEDKPIMKKMKIGGDEYEMEEKLADAIKKEMDAMKEKLDAFKNKKNDSEELTAKVDSLNKEIETLKGKNDSLVEEAKKAREAKMDRSQVLSEAKELAKLHRTAEKFLDEKTKIDEMDSLEIKKAIIKSRSEGVNLDGKSEEYICARFDQLMDLAESNSEFGKAIVANRKDSSEQSGVESVAEEARKKAMKADSEAWKQPLSASKKTIEVK